MGLRQMLQVALCAAITVPALAVVPKTPAAVDPRLVPRPTLTERSELIDLGEPSRAGSAARQFVERKGGQWAFSVDRRTGRPTLIQGSGIPMLPGKGNALGADVLTGLDLPDGRWTIQGIEPLVRDLIHEQPFLSLPDRGELVLNETSSQIRDEGRLVSVNYDWTVGGVPVEGAGVFVRLNSGNVTQFGARFIAPIEIEVQPAIGHKQAYARLLEHSGDDEVARPEGSPELLIQPEDGRDTINYRLVWKFRYTIFGAVETWEGRVDAMTGEVVEFRDATLYARAVGGVYPRTVIDAEVRAPFSNLNIDVDGSTQITDFGGQFTYSGGQITSGLDGRFFDTDCQSCSLPSQPGVQTTVGVGTVDFGLGGANQTGNGLSTRADRNAFYHLNQVRRIALKWLPGLNWLQTLNFDINVNVDNTCNATYNGAFMNFYRAGGGCNNTGEIADVIYHEWGHGVDLNTQGGDGGTGEGTADVNSMQLTHGPLVGPYFRTDGRPVRILDSTTSSLGVHTLTAIQQGACFVPQTNGDSVHCVGQVYGQSAWDLSQLLVAKHGHHTGWRTSERLFYTSLPDAGTYDPSSPVAIYTAYVQADDDDGNLANGTPNGPELFAAFNAHEIATTEYSQSPNCDRPSQPAVTAVATCDGVQVGWDAVPGVDHYEIFRAELLEDMALFPRGTFASDVTGFLDTEVAPEVPYWYVVMAVDASGCESTIENLVHVQLPDTPLLSLSASIDTDTPRGNRSGAADPGEDVDLILNLENVGSADAISISGTIVPLTPGVTLLAGASTWPNLPAGASGFSQDTLRFTTDDALVTCGDVLKFQFVPDGDGGCPAEASYFDVQIGEPAGGGAFVCDSTPACFVEPSFDGLSVAASGISCGEIDLSWAPASSNCLNATISYDVYRSTDPAFTPGPGNRVASSLASTFLTDALLEPGLAYSYIVRASDSRSGNENNLVLESAISPTTPDLRAPVFAGATSARSGDGCGETRITWSPALESCNGPVAYDIYRSTDPGFVPGPSNLIATSYSNEFIDAALEPGTQLNYVVRARDAAGNADGNGSRRSVTATILDRNLVKLDFEPDDAGWTVIAPNDAVRGNWEWGDPEAFSSQPEDDASIPGVNCWVTGAVATLPDGSNNDVDEGTTTLLSARYDLSQAGDPVVRYSRFFSNDRGSSPGDLTDSFKVDISNNDGLSWTPLETVGAGTPLEWVAVEFNVSSVIQPGERIRFRFTAEDLGPGSLVDAAIDEFALVDPDQGCIGCSVPAQKVGTILIDIIGDDVVLNWDADLVSADRYVIYSVSGPTLADAIPLGTTDQRSFVHTGGLQVAGPFNYRVSAVDTCGNESALD
jgi:hypothetical protein